MISASGTSVLARTLPRPLGSTHPFARPPNAHAISNRMPGSELYRHHNFGFARPDRNGHAGVSRIHGRRSGIPFSLADDRYESGERAKSSGEVIVERPGGIFSRIWRGISRKLRPPMAITYENDGYTMFTGRDLELSSDFTHRLIGMPIDAWVSWRIREAFGAGRRSFSIGVLGPGDGDAERELVEKIAYEVHSRGMKLKLTTISLPEHPMSDENVRAIGLYERAGIELIRHAGDFDITMPFEECDIIYGIFSTSYSQNQFGLTARLHNALRAPIGDLPGGEAFFMYLNDDKRYTRKLLERRFNPDHLDIDMTIIPIPDTRISLAHMVRTNPSQVTNFKGRLRDLRSNEGMLTYRAERGKSPIRGDLDSAFATFVDGARFLFSELGYAPDILSTEKHQDIFYLLLPGILRGQPIIPEAVFAAYAHEEVIDLIGKHGDDYENHLPPTDDEDYNYYSLLMRGIRRGMK